MSQRYQLQYNSQIPENAFVAVTWTLYALAVISVSMRGAVAIRMRKKLQIDFYLLVVSLLFLTASTIFVHFNYDSLYAIFAADAGTASDAILDEINGWIHRYVIALDTYLPLTWSAIFAAKFAYLSFFKKLIDRIKPLTHYWWVALIFTLLTYVLCLLQPLVLCAWSDDRVATCTAGNRFFLSLHYSIAVMCLDLITDIMIVSVAICILWKVEIRISQKLGIGAFLCMSIIMAMIAVIRVSRFLIPLPTGDHIYDTPWSVFWHQIEASVAVTLVSSTAFRMFFVARKHKRSPKDRQWYSPGGEKTRQNSSGISRKPSSAYKLPIVAPSSFPGMRIFVNKGDQAISAPGSSRTSYSEESTSVVERPESKIHVAKYFEIRIEEGSQEESHDSFAANRVVHPSLRHKLSRTSTVISSPG